MVVVTTAAVLVGGNPASALTASSPTGSHGRIPELSAADRAAMDAQAPFMQLNESIHQLADSIEPSPLAGVRLDVAHKQIFVYWAGRVPGTLDALRTSASAEGISMRIEPAAHSEKQLTQASVELSRFAESAQIGMTIDIRTDGSGLTVRHAGLRSAAQHRATATPEQARLLDAITTVSTKTGVPVDTADSTGPKARGLSRASDYSPYWAGAVTHTTHGYCTSGFSMYATGAPTRFMMTAAHCSGWLDGVNVTNGTGQAMGHTAFIHQLFDTEPRYDLGVIQLNSGLTNGPFMYLSDTTDVPVASVANSVPKGGNYCNSSAVSTPNCNIISGDQRVVCGSQVDPPIPFGRCVTYVTFTSKTGGVTLCEGDSGGPIYYWSGSAIIAAGVNGYGVGGGLCFANGGMSVVASAVNRANISGLRVLLH